MSAIVNTRLAFCYVMVGVDLFVVALCAFMDLNFLLMRGYFKDQQKKDATYQDEEDKKHVIKILPNFILSNNFVSIGIKNITIDNI